MSISFSVNKMDIEILARSAGVDWEPIAIERQLGEFYLAEEDEIEMREGDGGCAFDAAKSSAAKRPASSARYPVSHATIRTTMYHFGFGSPVYHSCHHKE